MSAAGGEPTPLRAGLELFLKHLGAPPVDVSSRLAAQWTELVGETLGAVSEPLEVRDGHLVIGCDDPAWAAQIGWMEAQLLERFQRLYPDVDLRRVSARVVPRQGWGSG